MIATSIHHSPPINYQAPPSDHQGSSLEERAESLFRTITSNSIATTPSLKDCKSQLKSIKDIQSELQSTHDKYLLANRVLMAICFILEVGVITSIIGFCGAIFLSSPLVAVAFKIYLIGLVVVTFVIPPLLYLTYIFEDHPKKLARLIQAASDRIQVLEKRVLPSEVDGATNKQFPEALLALIYPS